MVKTQTVYKKGGQGCFMKKMLIIGLSVFLAGALLFTIALSSQDWNIENISTRPAYTRNEYLFNADGVDSITVNDNNMDFNVGLSNDEQIHVICYENKKESYKVTRGSDIFIQKQESYEWFDQIFSIDFQHKDFTLLLPADYKGEINIDTSNGKITAKKINCKNLKLVSTNGSITVNDNVIDGFLKIKTSNDSIISENNNITGELSAETTNNQIELSNIVSQNIETVTTNGKINLNNVVSYADINAKSTNGSISLKDLKADNDITLKSTNGDIAGDIVGELKDYSITTKTTNGQNNLPESLKLGDKNFSADTTNGAIHIEFNK